MITSENIVFKTQFKSFFHSVEKSCSVLKISFFYISNKFIDHESCDVMTNINIRGRLHFGIYAERTYVENRKPFDHKTRPTNKYSHAQNF